MERCLNCFLVAFAAFFLAFTKGINSGRVPNAGVCPNLPPPSHCTDKYDFCKTDADCRLANYKCCSNGCKKICAVAVANRIILKINETDKRVRRGDCPPLPITKFCFDHESHYCSNDFHCDEYYKCCSNGCTRKCVVSTSKIAIGNGSKTAHATCPHFPTKSSNCPVGVSNQCSADNDCSDQGNSFKCCWDGCRKICLDPSEIQQTEGRGSCPALRRQTTCTSFQHECIADKECTKGKKCCSDGCTMKCVNAKGSTTPLKTVTTDTSLLFCPIALRPDVCPDANDTCDSLGDCASGQKCCHDGCNFRCFGKGGFQPEKQGPPPTTVAPTTTNLPPTTTSAPTTAELQTTTEGDVTTEVPTTAPTTNVPTSTEDSTTTQRSEPPTTTENPTHYVAAGNRPTTKRYTKPGMCPYVSRSCLSNLCFDDLECRGIQKCCSGCCVRPQANVANAPAKGQPNKPGICPMVSRLGIQCPSTDQCGVDQDCADNKKCCSHYCRRKVCVEPPSKEEERRLMSRLYRPGKCRKLKRPIVCQKNTKVECNYDVDCQNPTQKCCSDGCRRQCVDPVSSGPIIPVDPPTSIPVRPGQILGRCPPYSPDRSCPKLVQDDCTCSSDCGSGYKCCFDGCKRICRRPAGNECTARLDIVYLMDTSGSISLSDYDREKQFVKDLARIFRVAKEGSRSAVTIYNDDPYKQIKFGDHLSSEEFSKAVDGIPYLHGRTRIDKALKSAYETFQDARANVRKVLVLLTDGRQTQDPDSVPLNVASQPLKDMGVKIYAIGVGQKIDKQELGNITGNPSDVFTVDSFTALLGESQTIAAKACGDIIGKICIRGVDLGFIVDSSESITDDDFIKEKNAIKAISDEFVISPQSTRVGVVVYSSQPQINIDFDQYKSNSAFNRAVNTLPHMQSHTRLDMALRYAASKLYNKRRPANPAIAIVMTDGKQTPGAEPLSSAVQPLRDLGVRIFAVGVGPRVSEKELREIVNSYDDVFTVDSFSQLIAEAKKITQRACPAPSETKLPPSEPPTIAMTTPTPAPSTVPITTIAPTTPVSPTNLCSYFLDIIFVLDSSRSMDVRQYVKQKEFVKKLAKLFNVGRGSRAAAIIYSDDPILSIDFDLFSSQEGFLDGVDKLPYIMQRTRIDKALKMASDVLKDTRPGFPKAVIIMTDGRQTRDPGYTPLDVAAAPLHQAGARVLVVGIGPAISVDELGKMVKDDKTDIFTVKSFDGLVNATSAVAIKSCQGTVPTDIPDSCSDTFDLAFVMDSSGSMPISSYNKEKRFVKNIAGRFAVGPNKVALGLLTFSDWPNVLVPFGSSSSVSTNLFNVAVDNAQYIKGRTRIDRALNEASNLFKRGRPNVPKVMVFLTDGGQSTDPGFVPIEIAMRPLIEQKVQIIVVGIGKSIDTNQLYTLASQKGRDVTQVSSFDDLEKLKNSFAQTICRKIEETIQHGSL